jgi:hypothetical protein
VDNESDVFLNFSLSGQLSVGDDQERAIDERQERVGSSLIPPFDARPVRVAIKKS